MPIIKKPFFWGVGAAVVLSLTSAPVIAAQPTRHAASSVSALDGSAARAGDPGRLTVHFVPADDGERELVFDLAGTIAPPTGRYRYWVQGDWQMTPFAALGGGSPDAQIYTTLPLSPAGKVALPPNARSEPHLSFHVLYVERPPGELRWELLVRRPVAEVGDGVLMPAGRVVAGLWDRRSRRYVALSRPFQVRPRAVVEAPLRVPARGADLVAEVRWRTSEQPYEDATAKFWIQAQEKRIEPNLVVAVAHRSYAFWYGLDIAKGELRADAPGSFVRLALELRPQTIERITVGLGAKASLGVEVRLPPGLREDAVTLHLRELPTPELVASHELLPAHHLHRFEGLLPGTFEVVLETRAGKFTEMVELSEGEDGYVVLEPELIALRGRVLRGEKGHPGTLTFVTTGRDSREALADEEGAYEVTLLRPALSVSIALLGAQGEPFLEFFNPFIRESGELDFRVPDTRFRVRVVDQETGRGIGKASVRARNSYLQEEGGLGAAPGERTVSQSATADKDGWAVLAPLRPGSVEVWASGDGYLPSASPARTAITAEDDDRALELRLEPVGDAVAVRLLLAQGAAASGANALLVADLTQGSTLFSATADAEGQLKIPRRYAGILVVKHPAAGFSVSGWQPGEEETRELLLPPPAAQPLQVRVTDASGAAVPAAMLALWSQGQRLSGGVLSFLTGRAPRADQGGYWTAHGLPPGPVAVLAWSSHPRVQGMAMGGLLDSQAVAVDSPWPPVVEVRLAE